MDIKIENLEGKEIKALLAEHLLSMTENSPPESIHALDISGLKKSDITFWSIWKKDELLGCGALKELNKQHAELKSMRTAHNYLRKGVARQLLEYIIVVAQQRSYLRISLETGSQDVFEPARCLYTNMGFEYCESFGGYVEDPSSVFMKLDL